MKQVAADGGNINYIDKGEGMPIVLVHGTPTSSFLWRKMIGDLAVHGRVIAPDLPGFGFSNPLTSGDYSISNYARLLGNFLEALSIEEGVLICHDFGGHLKSCMPCDTRKDTSSWSSWIPSFTTIFPIGVYFARWPR